MKTIIQKRQATHEIFHMQKEEQRISPYMNYKKRRFLIKKLYHAMFAYREQIHFALKQDLKRHPAETDLNEIYVILNEARYALRHLKRWMSPKTVKTPINLTGTSSCIYPEAKGVVLILSPWNFPINLSFCPLISALAAGNRVILKPSEQSPASSAIIKKIIHELYNPKEVSVIIGDPTQAALLSSLPFDHIFFTGSSTIAKKIMKAAAKNLTPITLELGGKSPAIIDENASLKKAAKKIAWSKFMNSGQVCISPDYVLVHEKKEKLFLDLLKHYVQKIYKGEKNSIENSDDYSRLISVKHWERLQTLLNKTKDKKANIELEDNYIKNKKIKKILEPIIVSNITSKNEIMQKEIFGPILPVLPFSSIDQAISLINQKEKALAIYIFSKNKANIKKILQNTSTGGGSINTSLIHFFNPNLPFGGIGMSGIGMSHGYFGFQEFSHNKGILRQTLPWDSSDLFVPPYTRLKHKVLQFFMKLF